MDKIGQTKIFDGQAYECAGLTWHHTVDDRETLMAVWASYCATCGAPFEFKRPAKTRCRFEPNRRCDLHKAPGRRVNPRTKKAKDKPPAAAKVKAKPGPKPGATRSLVPETVHAFSIFD